MKKIIEFVKKYKVHILASLCFIFFFRSCQKSGEIRKISKNNTESTTVVDSLNNVISVQKKTIDGIPQLIKDEKLKGFLIKLEDFYTRADKPVRSYTLEEYGKANRIPRSFVRHYYKQKKFLEMV